jgi:hypothetical protein
VLSAIEILIERTKTNPEEFANGYAGDFGKWDDVIKEFTPCMTTEEREALEAALTNARREMFNEAVMKRLVGTDGAESSEDLLKGMANNLPNKRPTKILTMSQITADSLKILEQQLTMKGIKYATEYDVATDSYTLAQQRKK